MPPPPPVPATLGELIAFVDASPAALGERGDDLREELVDVMDEDRRQPREARQLREQVAEWVDEGQLPADVGALVDGVLAPIADQAPPMRTMTERVGQLASARIGPAPMSADSNARHDGLMFLGDDLLAWLVLALGGALLVGNVAAIVRPPDEPREEGALRQAPVAAQRRHGGRRPRRRRLGAGVTHQRLILRRLPSARWSDRRSGCASRGSSIPA